MSSSSSSSDCDSVFGSVLHLPTSLGLTPELFFAYLSAVLFVVVASRWDLLYNTKLFIEFLFVSVPTIEVDMTVAEAEDNGVTTEPSKTTDINDKSRPGFIQCYDPSTRQHLGQVKAMSTTDVHELCVKASEAQKKWANTTYAQRRMVLRTIQKYIVNHIEDLCRVCTRDSGKPKVDALLGEVMTTCEKIRTINSLGEVWLRPSYRPTGPLMMHKSAYVEYVPLGVLGVIAPWNYPVSISMESSDTGLLGLSMLQ